MSHDDLEDALVELFEVATQASYDLLGEVREWHLPRLTRVTNAMRQLFPVLSDRALRRARDAWGDPLVPEEDMP